MLLSASIKYRLTGIPLSLSITVYNHQTNVAELLVPKDIKILNLETTHRS